MKLNFSANCLDLVHISWKNCKMIKRKAMEESLSPLDLAMNLSIAFFVIIASSYTLSSVYYHLLNR